MAAPLPSYVYEPSVHHLIVLSLNSRSSMELLHSASLPRITLNFFVKFTLSVILSLWARSIGVSSLKAFVCCNEIIFPLPYGVSSSMTSRSFSKIIASLRSF